MRYVLVVVASLLVANLAQAQVTIVHELTPKAMAVSRWVPTKGLSFDIQLEDPSNANRVPRVQVVELDIDIDQAILNKVKARNIKAICYFNAGAWESYRDDAGSFPSSVKGNAYDGYPDERWLDIRQISTLAPLMRARLDRCKNKGFDAVDPDNVNGFENTTGFPLTAADQLAYNRWLMNEAHARGLSIALKNTTSLAAQLAADGYDFAVTESCFKYNFCNETAPFLTANKPVFDIEYVDERMSLTKFCKQAKTRGIDAILKRSSSRIDSYRQACR
jgi:hypothetical protein